MNKDVLSMKRKDAEALYEQLNIEKIEERNYWLVRSNSGEYYEDFMLHNYIAIAWDYVDMKMLNNNKENEIKLLIELNEKSRSETNDNLPDEEIRNGVVTSIYNKIYRFAKEFEIGDVVLVPSKNSELISIGILTSDVYENINYIEEYKKVDPDTELLLCPYFKRRKVQWLKTISKSKLDIYLIKAFSSHHAISSVNEYASFIDRNLYSIYSKGEELHTTLHAGHPNGLTLSELVKLSTRLEQSLIDISEQFNEEYNESNYNVKINIHSPGLLEIISYCAGAGIVLATFMFALNQLINGGKFRMGFKTDPTKNVEFFIESETKGIRGRNLEAKELEIKEIDKLSKLVKDLEIKSPEFTGINTEPNEDI